MPRVVGSRDVTLGDDYARLFATYRGEALQMPGQPNPNSTARTHPIGGSPAWGALTHLLRDNAAHWWALSLLAVCALTALMLPFREQLGILNVLLLFLLLTFSSR